MYQFCSQLMLQQCHFTSFSFWVTVFVLKLQLSSLLHMRNFLVYCTHLHDINLPRHEVVKTLSRGICMVVYHPVTQSCVNYIRITEIARCATDGVVWSVCLSVCMSVCWLRSWSLQKQVNQSRCSWRLTRMGPKTMYWIGVEIPHRKGQFLRVVSDLPMWPCG